MIWIALTFCRVLNEPVFFSYSEEEVEKVYLQYEAKFWLHL